MEYKDWTGFRITTQQGAGDGSWLKVGVLFCGLPWKIEEGKITLAQTSAVSIHCGHDCVSVGRQRKGCGGKDSKSRQSCHGSWTTVSKGFRAESYPLRYTRMWHTSFTQAEASPAVMNPDKPRHQLSRDKQQLGTQRREMETSHTSPHGRWTVS